MWKNRLRSIWVRLILGVLAFTAVLVILTLLLHRYWLLKNVSLGDALFMMGVLACAAASLGMLRNPYGEMLSPWGVPAHPIQPTEEEKRQQQIAEFIERRHFVIRLLAAGLLIILLSLVVSYLLKYTG